MKFDFLFQRRSNSHKYRIHQSPRTFPKFISLSACHPFENSLDYPLARQWKLVTRRGAFHPVVERWIAFVVDERKKDKRERERKGIRICLVRGWRTRASSFWQGIASVVCMYNTCAHANDPFCPQIDSVLHVHRATLAGIQITVHQAAYTPIRDAIETYTARKDYRRIVCSARQGVILWAKVTIDSLRSVKY